MIYLASYVHVKFIPVIAIYRDAERKKRVQEIFSLLQTQQAEAKREKQEKNRAITPLYTIV